MKSREEQLSWAKQRALICVDMGDFSDAVAGLRAGGAGTPSRSRLLPRRQPPDHVAVALARAAHGPQTGEDSRIVF